MIYKGLYFNIIIRVILLFLSCFWLSLCLQKPDKIYTLITVSSINIFQIVFLINYINKTNRDLARYFASLKDKDSSTHLKFNEKKGAYKELSQTLNEISELIGKSRMESEKHSRFFEILVEHIPIGLLSINSSGKISHSNKAVKELLQLEQLYSIDNIINAHIELGNEINTLKPGDQKIIKFKVQSQYLQILIRCTQIKFENDELKLISLQDVKSELEENELVSWQKLIRVLTHEIMNSITPISTLTLAINKCIDNTCGSELTPETVDDILTNTKLIEERTIGIQSFVEKYRSLTKIQALRVSKINVEKLLHNCTSLFNKESDENNITISTTPFDKNLTIEADEKLIEQVIINLIKNAIESIKDSKENIIKITVNQTDNNKTKIIISDSGIGIPDNIIDQIFMPFFTTKEQGSGIGLSLARQIMRLHGGSISVKSEPNIQTSFTLTF